MAGIGTVLKDDPTLNCRLTDENGNMTGRNPVRIICDSNLRLPLESRIVKTAGEIQTIAACAVFERAGEEKKCFEEKKSALQKSGIEVIEVKSSENHTRLNLVELMKILGEKKIDSVLVEGGGEINYAALKSGIVNKIYVFVAPKIFGGKAKSPVGGEGVSLPDESFAFKLQKTTNFDGDVLLEYGKIDVQEF